MAGQFKAEGYGFASNGDDENDLSNDLTDSLFTATKKTADTAKAAKDKVKQARKRIYREYAEKIRARYQGRTDGYGDNSNSQNENNSEYGPDSGNDFTQYADNGSEQFNQGSLFEEANFTADADRIRQQERISAYARQTNAKGYGSAYSQEAARQRANRSFIARKYGRGRKQSSKEAERQARKEAQKDSVKRSYKKSAVTGKGTFGKLAKNAGNAAAQGAKEGSKAAADASAKAGAAAAESTAAAGSSAAGSSAAAGGWVTLIIAAVILILFILFMILLYNAFVPVIASIIGIGGSYQSEAKDIDAAEEALQLLECDLKEDILNIETDYPDYDEYEYDPEGMEYLIGHNPYTLINYLSAVYVQFTLSEVEAEIQSLFDEMYKLELEEKTETRIRYVVDLRPVLDEDGEPVIDEETGEEVYEEYLKEEEYEVDILVVKLTVKSLDDIVSERLADNESAKDLYEIYEDTKGLRQCFDSPIEGGYGGKISSYYGWRIHPITGQKRFHKGLDIAVPEGTDVHSAQDGTVILAGEDPGGYGYYMMVENADGYKSLYAHLSGFYKSVGDVVKAGDIIAASGNTGGSTGPHLHLEVFYENENYNPLFYVNDE